jgi:hypothetical protein
MMALCATREDVASLVYDPAIDAGRWPMRVTGGKHVGRICRERPSGDPIVGIVGRGRADADCGGSRYVAARRRSEGDRRSSGGRVRQGGTQVADGADPRRHLAAPQPDRSAFAALSRAQQAGITREIEEAIKRVVKPPKKPETKVDVVA